jgi:hypothetical protein
MVKAVSGFVVSEWIMEKHRKEKIRISPFGSIRIFGEVF